ncbi:hypothetical protein SAMN05444920_114285 [Nonomuraea solani]|uniref:Uncharacterized protein n=1 Tax=Nonomuraea solani TaxID=1144553 RepID=A0A1H6ET51_9ACTN|nr:hypothetical protein [Nonomuraea solani]SEH00009.1 hypothetical protein SAMN05444920_114285 [Nonomuraea solani]
MTNTERRGGRTGGDDGFEQADRAREVFDAFRELTADAPDEPSLWFNRVRFPQAPPMAGVDLAFLGAEPCWAAWTRSATCFPVLA